MGKVMARKNNESINYHYCHFQLVPLAPAGLSSLSPSLSKALASPALLTVQPLLAAVDFSFQFPLSNYPSNFRRSIRKGFNDVPITYSRFLNAN